MKELGERFSLLVYCIQFIYVGSLSMQIIEPTSRKNKVQNYTG